MLPRAWDHLRVLPSIADPAVFVKLFLWSLAPRGTFDDEHVGSLGQPVDGRLGQQGVAGHRHPFSRLTVGTDDGGLASVPLHDDFVEVIGLGGVQLLNGEIV